MRHAAPDILRFSAMSVPTLLAHQAAQRPDAPALLAPGRRPFTYRHFGQQLVEVVTALRARGVGAQDRVALVMPPGPEFAMVCLSVTSAAVCAPLNPAFQAPEFEFYLTDLQAGALIIQQEMPAPARSVARALGIPVVELVPAQEAEAGVCTLLGPHRATRSADDMARPEDVALILHTSGTTARPKRVPLTHGNICTSAANIQTALSLEAHDRCLNLMPLFHIHGLIAGLLASLRAGASVICPPGFDASEFFRWLGALRPTWYTAVPTMHQAILALAPAHEEAIAGSRLRFIRSSSASLPGQVRRDLEAVFRVPVVEAYGMTEAAHQIASNPLPPRPRKAGAVGIAAGPDVAAMDETGRLLPAGETGEIVIRGANVTPGYENDQEANRLAFTQGWFRTGDVGWLDTDGYLFLSGRLKELINRGGEKIAPCEVEEVLLMHPAVARAAVFAVPHAHLGEEVGAAVVSHAGVETPHYALRRFAAQRLADFKVPRRIVMVETIPLGPTGKLQRLGLAERLGLERPGAVEAFVAPSTPVEVRIAEIWQEILGEERVGVFDNFFDAGGHSLLAVQVIARLHEHLGVRVQPRDLMLQTLGQLAASCEAQLAAGGPSPAPECLARKVWRVVKHAVWRRGDAEGARAP
jgi:acyl-CoA synthetase (AMP-forming)/AMP-acid ligase II/acyl carrier protein